MPFLAKGSVAARREGNEAFAADCESSGVMILAIKKPLVRCKLVGDPPGCTAIEMVSDREASNFRASSKANQVGQLCLAVSTVCFVFFMLAHEIAQIKLAIIGSQT